MNVPCIECGNPAEQEHHVVPRVSGGTKTVPLCCKCHGKIHSLNLATGEMVKEGMRRAREKGVYPGKKRAFDVAQARFLKDLSGMDMRRISVVLKVPHTAIKGALRK